MGGSRDPSAIILTLLLNLNSWIRYDVTHCTNTIESNTSTGVDWKRGCNLSNQTKPYAVPWSTVHGTWKTASHCRDVQAICTAFCQTIQFILRCFLLLCFLFVILIDSEVIEYSLSKLLERLQINHQEVRFTSDSLKMTAKRITCFLFLAIFSHQFVDLCILLGCDYCEKICGLGPKRALTLIQKHRTIENVILHVNRKVLGISFFDKISFKKLLSD